jgi:hypothetical protein
MRNELPRFQAPPGNVALEALPPLSKNRGRTSRTAFLAFSQEREVKPRPGINSGLIAEVSFN